MHYSRLTLLAIFAVIVAGQRAHAEFPPVDDPVYMGGSSRPRAPQGWATFDWASKRAVLFGQYAPTTEEKRRMLQAMPLSPAVEPKQSRKLLVFYRCQYPHAAIAFCNVAIGLLGPSSGAFETTVTDDPNGIRAETLQQYDALLLNNTTDWDVTIGAAGRQAVLDFVRGGKGLVLIHGATDACKNWPEGQRLTGAVFAGHHWIANAAWAFKVESPAHALNACSKNTGFWHCEEVYVFRPGAAYIEQSRILLSLDMSHPQNVDQVREDHRDRVDPSKTYAVAWVHSFGKGRVFSSSLGHNYSTYWQSKILRHFLAGIQFTMGDLQADLTASHELDIPELALAPAWQP